MTIYWTIFGQAIWIKGCREIPFTLRYTVQHIKLNDDASIVYKSLNLHLCVSKQTNLTPWRLGYENWLNTFFNVIEIKQQLQRSGQDIH